MQPGSTTSFPTIPDHELIRCIGRGAYGEVWLARHARLGTLRAVKIIRRDQFENDRPFQREFDGIRRYEPISRGHANLVAILHVGGADDCFFYVMELADDGNDEYRVSNIEPTLARPADSLVHRMGEGRGEGNTAFGIRNSEFYIPKTLRSELKHHGALPLDRCLEIGFALASALAHLHVRGLVHRDVKPSNVIFVGGVAKLADIGLVAAVSDSRSYVGTEGYIPPEGPGAPSADCYALGKLLYELSTGHDRAAWPEPPADLPLRPDRERLLELNAILHKACAPDARERYQSAKEMSAELELLQRGESVKRQRILAHRLVLATKILVTALAFALVVAGGYFLRDATKSMTRQSRATADGQRAENPEAMKLCKLARFHYYQITEESSVKAMECFNQALEIDPKCISAYAGIADLCVVSQPSRFLPPKSAEAKMRWAREKLMAIDSGRAEGHAVQGYINLVYDWKPGEADSELKLARELDPDLLISRIWRARFLVYTRRFDEAEQEYKKAQQLDPTRYGLNVNVALVPFFARRYDRAIEYLEKAAELMPNQDWAMQMIGHVNEERARYAEAIEAFQKSEVLSGIKQEVAMQKYDDLRNAYEKSGQDGYWRRRLALAQSENKEALAMARIYAHLGDADAALDQLDKAFHEKSERLLWLNVDPGWDKIHSDPRFVSLLKKMGLAKGD